MTAPMLPNPRPDISLDLGAPLAELALRLVNCPSVSGSEAPLADAVEHALAGCAHLQVLRHGNTVVARTQGGRDHRVIVAGHLDTVPVSTATTNVPGRREQRAGEEVIWGRGAVDMKGGVAVILALAAEVTHPRYDVTWVLYDNEEVAADRSGLGKAMAAHPDWFEADFAVLGEPTSGGIEGGCNGTLRLILEVPGVAAHSARAWCGRNAIHAAGTLIRRCETAPLRNVTVDGLAYRESLNVVLIEGGVATNTIPPSCRLTINYRFAPDLTAQQALTRVKRILAGQPEDSSLVTLAQGLSQDRDAAAPTDETGRDNGAGIEDGGASDVGCTDAGQAADAADTALTAEPIIDVGTGPVRVTVDDLCEGARPGLDSPLAADLVTAVRARGRHVQAKVGWTDVARLSAAGVPAINLGPGDPLLCHTDDEHCPVCQLDDVAAILRQWLTGGDSAALMS